MRIPRFQRDYVWERSKIVKLLMSYCANIRTLTKIEPQSLFEAIADSGEQIVVTSAKFPSLHFGTFKYALRGVEVNQEEDGYEVRAFSMSSMADYQLFPKVVCAIQELTGGDVYDEEDEKPVKDPKKRFGLKWRREQTESSWHITCALVRETNEPIIMNGLFAPFVIGKNILNAYTIDMDNPTGGEDYKRLGYLLFTNQWQLKDLIPTGTDLVLHNPNNQEQYLRLSLISSKGGSVCEFDYICYADLICIMNQDTGDFAMARFKYLDEILPEDKFQRIDELQFVRTAAISQSDFDTMLEKAKTYQEDDFFAENSWNGAYFKGDIQYISDSIHQLAIPVEFSETDVNDDFIEHKMSGDDYALTLVKYSCQNNQTIVDKETYIQDFRKLQKDEYGLIEVNEGETLSGKPYLYRIIKTKLQDDVLYHLSLSIQLNSNVIDITCTGEEKGITGRRNTYVFELERRNNNIRFDDNRVIGWNRDPYDESVTSGFLMNLSEQKKYDSMFPYHPLSLLRELARFIIEKN